MKKIKILLLLAVVCIGANSIFAADYKLYNPKENKTYSAELMTIGNGRGGFYIGLYNGINVCMVAKNTNVNSKGLLGGICRSLDGTFDYNWREYKPNTYKEEVEEIIIERKKEGLRYIQ